MALPGHSQSPLFPNSRNPGMAVSSEAAFHLGTLVISRTVLISMELSPDSSQMSLVTPS